MTRSNSVCALRGPGSSATGAVLRRIADDPAAPLHTVIVGPGGTGKSTLLDEVARAYEQAGVEVVRGGGTRALSPDQLTPGRAVLVDDAHRLDDAALDDLRGFTEAGPSRLVLAYRPWPRPAGLRAIVAGTAAYRSTIVVSHLDRAAVATRVTARLGTVPPDNLVDLVHEQSGGLPTLVDLVTQALRDTGRFDAARPQEFRRPDRISVSTSLAERLRHQVDALHPAVQALLEAMAVGAPLDTDVLRSLLAAPPEALVDTVEAARATGLLTESGSLIPFVRNLVLRLMPVLRARELQRRLADVELDRGGSVLAAGRRLLGTGASGTRVAAVLDAAAAEASTESPALAAELLAEAVAAGRAPLAVAARRARAAALVGELDQALRLADQAITDPAAPDRDQALATAATAMAHRGLLDRSAALHRQLPPAEAVLAVPALVGTGSLDEARALYAAALACPGASTLVAGAAMLIAGGVLASVGDPGGGGTASAALSQLARAGLLLEPVAPAVLLPDTPAALTALVALGTGELTAAETALRRAAAGRFGGRAAQNRHRLLHAWVAMTRGRLARARRTLDRVDAAEQRLEPRDELLAAALALGLARRENDRAALADAWSRCRNALVEHPVDLWSLPQLGECAAAAARLGEQAVLAPHLAEADALLDALGRPGLWAAPLHWSLLHAAVLADDPDAARSHAAALATGGPPGPWSTVLASAAATWCDVLDGAVDADAVQVVARRLHAAGLVWEAAHLAGQAGARATDRRSMTALQACARALADPAGRAEEPAAEPVAPVAPPEGGPTTGSPLSERELEIGRLVLAGLTYKQIGQQLFISAKTVEHHVARIRGRLGVTTRNDLFTRLRALA